MTLAGSQCLHYPELSPTQSQSVSTIVFIYLVKISSKLFNRCIFVSTGNYEGGVTSDADKVYEWNGDEEKWTVHGTIRERRSHVGVSLVPLSSQLMKYCT